MLVYPRLPGNENTYDASWDMSTYGAGSQAQRPSRDVRGTATIPATFREKHGDSRIDRGGSIGILFNTRVIGEPSPFSGTYSSVAIMAL